jgi:pilus assembly protein CpaE
MRRAASGVCTVAVELPKTLADAPAILAFIGDAETEATLRDSLAGLAGDGLDIRRGNITTAIAAMTAGKTPRVLIVDLSGQDQPMDALGELSDVVEPDVILLVIGETEDIGFYRHIIRGLGVTEYIFKPINRDAVARFFGPFINDKITHADTARGGRVIAFVGARGGVGATTIAANLAWYLGVIEKRHTVFVESDLYLGSGALLLGGKTGPGLRMALEAPDRIDPLFVDRAVQAIAGRLSILAGEEKLTESVKYQPGAAQRLIEALRLRFNFVIVNVPFLPLPLNREFLEFNHHRVIISDATLASLHDGLRLLALPNGLWQPQSATLVLNRQGREGTLARQEMEANAKLKFDVVIPDLPLQINESASLGQPAVMAAGAFHDAIAMLAQQVGFVSTDGHAVSTAGARFSLSGLFRRLIPHRG